MLQNDSFKVLARLVAYSSMPTIKVIDYEICFSKDPIKIYYSGTFTTTQQQQPIVEELDSCSDPELFSNIRIIVLLTIYYHRQDSCLLARKFFSLRSLCIVTVSLPIPLHKHIRRGIAYQLVSTKNKNRSCLGTYWVTCDKGKERKKRGLF